jgi:murein L,D-transpeptidase YcbB/YkuD
MKASFALSLLCLVLFYSCNNDDGKKQAVTKPDTSITKVNAYNPLFMDSSLISAFIVEKKVPDSFATRFRSFYNSRNFQYAWFGPDGPTEQTLSFWSLLKNYVGYSGDSSLYDKSLDNMVEDMAGDDSLVLRNTKGLQQAELSLTRSFFRYASRAYQGRRDFNMKSLEWYIPRKKIDALALLDSVVANKGRDIDRYAPIHPQYNLLRKQLAKYKAIEDKGGWGAVLTKKKTLKKGDSGEEIKALKKRLYTEMENATTDTTDIFDDSLLDAVKTSQRQYGYKEDGIVTTTLLKEINKPVEDRIEQLLINMERMRWVPSQPQGNYILVNIPEYRLHVFEDGKKAWDMDIVVGKEGNTTTIFTGDLSTVVFSPYWNVPPSITRNEIVPAMNRNSNYLANQNMEITGKRSDGLPIVRQKPGGKNALGKVKFLFPNSYNIYFHDSPAKSLFNLDKRSFSHGCIRLKEPYKMAAYLLRDNEKWTEKKIKDAMDKGEEQYVKLKESIPVFITYFTAWVDSSGRLNFREDIYGHDEKMAEKMFVQSK